MKSRFYLGIGILLLSLILGFVAVVRVSAANTEEISEEESQRREKAIGRMISGFKNMEESIDISDLGIYPEELKDIFSAATKNSPYLFFVGNDLRYTFRKGGCVVSVMPQYLYSEAEVKAMTEFLSVCPAERTLLHCCML